MKIICQFVKLPKTSIIFARNICRRFPSFLIAFARISHCFCPNFGEKQWQIRAKAMGNSGKSNGKIRAKAMRKLGKRRHIFRAKIIAFARISNCFSSNFPLLLPEFSIAFSRISHYFCPNFPLLLPEFPIAFPLISHCVCPNFLLLLPEFPITFAVLPEFPTAFARIFRFHFFFLGGGQCPPPPPPPTPMSSSSSTFLFLAHVIPKLNSFMTDVDLSCIRKYTERQKNLTTSSER